MLLASGSGALATVDVDVVALDPASGALALDAPLSVRVRYDSDRSFRIQARALHAGGEAAAITATAPAYLAGKGELVTWLALREPGAIQSVRVLVFDEQWTELDRIELAVDLEWRRDAAPREPAAWVAQIQVGQEARLAPVESPRAGLLETLLFAVGIPVSVIGYLVLQLMFALGWRGGWRRAALVPLLVTIPAYIASLSALVAGGNLWPLWIIFASPPALLYLVVLWLLRARAVRTPRA